MKQQPSNRTVYHRVIKELDDIKDIIDNYKAGSACMISFSRPATNFENLVSYISGAMYALDGEMEEISAGVYLLR